MSTIQAALPARALSWTAPKFGLDIAVQIQLAPQSAPTYIEVEVKLLRGQRLGGVGFGNKKGGTQVDILLSTADQLAILDRNIRWAFADAMQPCGSSRYALLTCLEARNAAMGGVVRGKQNNFKLSVIKAHLTPWPIFCEDLLAFIAKSKPLNGD